MLKGFFKKIVGGLASGENPIKEVADIAQGFGDSKEEKREFFNETLDRVLDDKQDARGLYKKDAWLHKIFGLTFLFAYIGLTAWIVYAIVKGQLATVTQFETGLIGTIWGGMSAKVNTVTDFLFGASDQNSEATKSLYQANNPADRAKMRHERKMARIDRKEEKKQE